MKIQQKVYSDIVDAMKSSIKESGGIIGSKGNIITVFEFDRTCTVGEYIPDTFKLNAIIKKWYQNDILFAGLVHSHYSNKYLSYADIEYAKNIITSNSLDRIIMLVYVHENNKLYAYKISAHKKEVLMEKENIDVSNK